MTTESKQPVPPFHQRLNIDIAVVEFQQMFINRVMNNLNSEFPQLEDWGEDEYDYRTWTRIMPHIANKLGKMYTIYSFGEYVNTSDFLEFLRALEALYEAFDQEYNDDRPRMLEEIIVSALAQSDLDLGVEWRDGAFWPAGARLLDEALVNENLKWLADKGYQDVLVPFEKGLGDFLEAIQKPERLADTVTDVYEAVEALAKRITGKERHLSENAELFVSKLKLGEYYKKMLKDYIKYANDYRHAAKLGKGKQPLSRNEVEAFIYTSGLFIRLAVQQSA
jgi:hypothetical protein